jgi:hypothetical protein
VTGPDPAGFTPTPAGISFEDLRLLAEFRRAYPEAVVVRDAAGAWKGHATLRDGSEIFKVRLEGEGQLGGGLPKLLEDLETMLTADRQDTG